MGVGGWSADFVRPLTPADARRMGSEPFAEDPGRLPFRAMDPSGLAAVSWGPDRIDLFRVDDDRVLWHRALIGGEWTAEESLGGPIASAPAVTAWAPDAMEVFAVFADGALWDRYWDGTSWHPWESLGGELDPGSVPAASSWGPDRLDVFGRGRDGRTWHRWWDGRTWVPWERSG